MVYRGCRGRAGRNRRGERSPWRHRIRSRTRMGSSTRRPHRRQPARVTIRPPTPLQPPAVAPRQSAQAASQGPASAPSTAALAKEVEQKLFVSGSALASTAATVAAVASKEGPAAAVGAPDVDLAPVSKKGLAHPACLGPGTVGKKAMIRANHYLVNVADNNLFHYDQLTMKGKLPAYDGRKSPYTAGSLPFGSEEFVVKLVVPEKKDKKGRKGCTRSQFELLGGQTCTVFSSFCGEDRGICLKKPSKYLMLSSGSHHPGSITSIFQVLVMSQCPDPFSPLILVTEETLVRD